MSDNRGLRALADAAGLVVLWSLKFMLWYVVAVGAVLWGVVRGAKRGGH